MEENNNISHDAPEKEKAVKGTNGWAIAGFIASFVTTIIGLILSIIGLVEAKKHEWQKSLIGLAIAGLIISLLKLILTIAVIIFLVSIFNKINLFGCIGATNCVEQDDGSYICEKNDESVTCLFDPESLVYDYDMEIDDIIDDDLLDDIDMDINLVNSGYDDYDDAVNYLITNYYNLTFTYKTSNGEEYLDETTKQSIVIELETFTPEKIYEGELSEDLDYVNVIFKNKENKEYHLTIYDNNGTNIVVIENVTDNTLNKYELGSITDIFELI